jgi:hypothetical protein
MLICYVLMLAVSVGVLETFYLINTVGDLCCRVGQWSLFNIKVRAGPEVWVAQAHHNFSCPLIIKY